MIPTNTGKNIWYSSVSSIAPAIFTYIFWFTAAKLAGTEAIGIASSIAALVDILATIDVLDMSLGMKRSLGLAISSGDLVKFKQILTSTIVFVSIILVISEILITIPNLGILEMLGFDRQYVLIVIAMIPALSFQYIFREALIAALQSKNLVMPLLIGSFSRFPILFCAFYLFNAPTLGTIFAYSSMIFISMAFFAIYSIRIFNRIRAPAMTNILPNIIHILKAGLASWIPHVINVLGYQLGIITVLAATGAAEAAKFYIPMGIFMVTLFIVSGSTKVTHALIGSIEKEKQQTKLLSYSMKIAFVLTMPLATPLLFYASNFLQLMGREFASASVTLSILIVSLPIVIICEMIFYFIYGRGDHRSILFLGLMGNVPRIVLYFVLSPNMGANGTALAWLIGSVTQLILSVIIGNKHSLDIQYKKYGIITAIPFAIGSITWLININYIISTIVIFFGSILLYIKSRLLTDIELHDLLYSALPENIAGKIFPYISKMVHLICD